MCIIFFFNDTATTEIYALSLHDALPISRLRPVPADRERRPERRRGADRARVGRHGGRRPRARARGARPAPRAVHGARPDRSEEHTSELQSRQYLVCRLLLEKKNIK